MFYQTISKFLILQNQFPHNSAPWTRSPSVGNQIDSFLGQFNINDGNLPIILMMMALGLLIIPPLLKKIKNAQDEGYTETSWNGKNGLFTIIAIIAVIYIGGSALGVRFGVKGIGNIPNIPRFGPEFNNNDINSQSPIVNLKHQNSCFKLTFCQQTWNNYGIILGNCGLRRPQYIQIRQYDAHQHASYCQYEFEKCSVGIKTLENYINQYGCR